MKPQTIAFENVSLSDTKITKLSYLSTISNDIFETIMVEVKIEEPRNVTHVVAHLAYCRGYSWPLEPLQDFYFNPEIDTLCPVTEEEWSSEAFYTLCEVMKIIKVSIIAISDCMYAEDARRSLWGTFYTMSKIKNWSSSFKDIMMHTTKQSFEDNYRPEFVTFEGSRITLSMYQSKAWSIQMHHARPMLKKLIAMKDAQDMADKEAERNGEVGSLDPEIGENNSGRDEDNSVENDGNSDEDENSDD
ncbi:hypothetical protein H4I96_08555 [Botrytis cinerea]